MRWDLRALQVRGDGVRVPRQQLRGGVQRFLLHFRFLHLHLHLCHLRLDVHLEPLGRALHLLEIAEAGESGGAEVAGYRLRDVGHVVQHVGGRGLQVVAPLVVGGAGQLAGASSLADGRGGLGHDALRMLHHEHLPLEVAHQGGRAAAAVGGGAGAGAAAAAAHILGAHGVLPGRGGGTAASVVTVGALQLLRLLRKVIADGLADLAAAPDAAAARFRARSRFRGAAHATAVPAAVEPLLGATAAGRHVDAAAQGQLLEFQTAGTTTHGLVLVFGFRYSVLSW